MPLLSSLTIKSIESHTADSIIVEFDYPQGFSFKSGQHISLEAKINEERVFRTYSICESPSKKKLSIGVRVLPNGLFSSWLKKCSVGHRLKASNPSGLFYLRPPRKEDQHNLFIAAGSGITPIISMLEEFLEQHPSTSATLIYGNRCLASSMFLDRLMELKNLYLSRLEIHFFTSQEQPPIPWQYSRVNSKAISFLIDQKVINLSQTGDIYLCGPLAMMEEGKSTFQTHGFDADHLFFEYFEPAKSSKINSREEQKTRNKVISQIDVLINGAKRRFPFLEGDTSILAAARRNRITLPFACTGGMCGTCRTKVLAGEVTMTKNYSLEPDDLTRNFILSCQSRPLTKNLSLNFDY